MRISRHVKNHGMNWIRKEKRLAIYLRDGLACCYCGMGIEDEVTLTLDHLKCYTHGGSNNPDNLVTACLRCNSARGSRSWKRFAGHVARYVNHGVTSARIIRHIQRQARKGVDVKAAIRLIAKRGGFVAAMNRKGNR